MEKGTRENVLASKDLRFFLRDLSSSLILQIYISILTQPAQCSHSKMHAKERESEKGMAETRASVGRVDKP